MQIMQYIKLSNLFIIEIILDCFSGRAGQQKKKTIICHSKYYLQIYGLTHRTFSSDVSLIIYLWVTKIERQQFQTMSLWRRERDRQHNTIIICNKNARPWCNTHDSVPNIDFKRCCAVVTNARWVELWLLHGTTDGHYSFQGRSALYVGRP